MLDDLIRKKSRSQLRRTTKTLLVIKKELSKQNGLMGYNALEQKNKKKT